MDPELMLRIGVIDDVSQHLDRIKKQLEELEAISGGLTGNQASRERIQNSKREAVADKARSDEYIANKRAEQTIDTNASKVTIADINTRQRLESERHRNYRAELSRSTAQERIAGQNAERTIRRQRLEEQRLAREQRERFAALRAQQRSIAGGFGSWTSSFREFLSFFAGAALEDTFRRIAARIVDVSSEFERLRLGLVAIEGRAGVADSQLRRLRQLAELPNVGFTSGIRAVTGLRGAGISFDQAERLIREISNVAALSGATQEDLTEALRQFRQAFSAETFTQQDLRPILQRIPLLQPAFRQVFGGITAGQVNQSIRQQGLTFPQAYDRLTDELARGPRAAADTFQNASERLQDSFDDLARDIGSGLLPVLRDILNALNRFFQFLRTDAGRTVLATVAGVGLAGVGRLAAGAFGTARGLGQLARSAGQGVAFQGGLFGLGAGLTPQPGQRSFLRLGVGVYPEQTFRGEYRDAYRFFRRQGVGPIGSARNAFHGALATRPGLGGLTGRLGRLGGARVGATPAALAAAGVTGALTYQGILGVEDNVYGRPGFRSFIGGLAGGGGGAPVIGRQYEGFQDVYDILNGLGSATANFTRNLDTFQRTLDITSDTSRLSTEAVVRFSDALQDFNRVSQSTRTQLADHRQNIVEQLRQLGLAAQRGREQDINERIERDIRSINVTRDEARRIAEEEIPEIRTRAQVLEYLNEAQQARLKLLEQELGIIDQSTKSIEESARRRREEAQSIQGELERRADIAREPLVRDGVFGRLRPDEGFVVRDRPRPSYADIGAGLNFEESQINQPFDATPGRRRSQIRPQNIEDLNSGAEGLTRSFEQARDLSLETSRYVNQIARSTSEILSANIRYRTGTPSGPAGAISGPSFIGSAQVRSIQDTIDATAQAAIELNALEAPLVNVGEELYELKKASEASARAIRQLIEGTAGLPRTLDDIIERFRERFRQSPFGQFGRQFGDVLRQFDIPRGRELLQQEEQENLRRENERQQDRQRIENYISGSAEDLYDRFIGPSILDAVGIGSTESRREERQIETLERSIAESRQRIREDEQLSARQQAEQLLEITREYEREKREIERANEEARSDAWHAWVRQQLLDIPKLIFEQLKLQLAAKTTNEILNALGVGGGGFSPTFGFGGGGGGRGAGFLDSLRSFFGQGPADSFLSGYGGVTEIGTNFGSALSSLGGTGATVGTVASAALAGHNVYTGIREGLFDDIGRDVLNGLGELIPKQGKNNGNVYLVSGDTQFNNSTIVGFQEVRQISYTMDDMVRQGRI